MIGQNWLLRAQKSLAHISQAERGSSSSEASIGEQVEKRGASPQTFAEGEQRFHEADYVEARGILLPATEYLQRAVDAAKAQGTITGSLLSKVNIPPRSTYIIC